MVGDRSELDRCKRLVEEINESAAIWGSFSDQTCWKGLSGAPIYGSSPDSDLGAGFFERLHRERQIFSGEPLVPELTCLPPIPESLALRYHRQIYRLCLRERPDWGAYEFARLASALPRKFRCKMPIDNGGVKIAGYLANRETAAYQERVFLMHQAGILQRLRPLPRPLILEIGSGFGALAYCIKKIVPRAHYVLVDLPGSLIHAACWLTRWLPNFDLRVYQEGTLPSSDFVLVPHTATDALSSAIDLAINTLSFGEMTESAVRHYGLFVKDRLARGAGLFEQNFDNTDQGVDGFCNPARVLSEIFAKREIVSRKSWRGVASVWS